MAGLLPVVEEASDLSPLALREGVRCDKIELRHQVMEHLASPGHLRSGEGPTVSPQAGPRPSWASMLSMACQSRGMEARHSRNSCMVSAYTHLTICGNSWLVTARSLPWSCYCKSSSMVRPWNGGGPGAEGVNEIGTAIAH
eukprot:1080812-Pyramimonas_sp.AAC.1